MTAYFATIPVIILRKQRGQLSYIREKVTICNLCLRYHKETMVVFGPGEDMFIYNGGTFPPIYDKIWIAKLINEGIAFIPALRKGIINMKEYRGRRAGNKFTSLIAKDSVLYFLV